VLAVDAAWSLGDSALMARISFVPLPRGWRALLKQGLLHAV